MIEERAYPLRSGLLGLQSSSATYFTSLTLSFLICEMWKITVPTSWGHGEDYIDY